MQTTKHLFFTRKLLRSPLAHHFLLCHQLHWPRFFFVLFYVLFMVCLHFLVDSKLEKSETLIIFFYSLENPLLLRIPSDMLVVELQFLQKLQISISVKVSFNPVSC